MRIKPDEYKQIVKARPRKPRMDLIDDFNRAFYPVLIVKARPRKPRMDYKAKFEQDITLLGYPQPEREVLFAHPRRWRFDWAWPDLKIAVEYQGGNFHGRGGHNSISGLRRDYEKFTEAALLGWIVILIDAASVTTGQAINWLERALDAKGAL